MHTVYSTLACRPIQINQVYIGIKIASIACVYFLELWVHNMLTYILYCVSVFVIVKIISLINTSTEGGVFGFSKTQAIDDWNVRKLGSPPTQDLKDFYFVKCNTSVITHSLKCLLGLLFRKL
jgi:hypothetical protein